MIVVDVETTGVDPQKHSLTSIGAIDFENPENRFYAECKIFERAHVDPKALELTGMTEAQITDPIKKTDREILEAFIEWTKTTPEDTIAGQNPSFDRDFLMATAYRYHINWPFAFRTIDLHSVAYSHLMQKGEIPPTEKEHSKLDLDYIVKYCGIETKRGAHNAMEDTLLEAECLSRLIRNHKLLKEYDQYEIPWLS